MVVNCRACNDPGSVSFFRKICRNGDVHILARCSRCRARYFVPRLPEILKVATEEIKKPRPYTKQKEESLQMQF